MGLASFIKKRSQAVVLNRGNALSPQKFDTAIPKAPTHYAAPSHGERYPCAVAT
jgi:hypothetical protein